MKCNIHTKYFTSCNHPEQWFFSQQVTRKNKKKKFKWYLRKMTITSKRVGFSFWDGNRYTLLSETHGRAWTSKQNQNSTSKERRKCELGKRPTVLSVTQCFRNMNFYYSACCYASLINWENWEFNRFSLNFLWNPCSSD